MPQPPLTAALGSDSGSTLANKGNLPQSILANCAPSPLIPPDAFGVASPSAAEERRPALTFGPVLVISNHNNRTEGREDGVTGRVNDDTPTSQFSSTRAKQNEACADPPSPLNRERTRTCHSVRTTATEGSKKTIETSFARWQHDQERRDMELMEQALCDGLEQKDKNLREWAKGGFGERLSAGSTMILNVDSKASFISLSTLRFRYRLARVLRSQIFDFFIGIVITMNAITIGIDQSLRMNGGSETALAVVHVFEHIFMIIYVLELSMRFLERGIACLQANWVKFDFALVILGVANSWILEPTIGKNDALEPLLVLRLARLLRLARTVRLLMKFRELWMLVRGLLSSASTMIYTFVLLCMILYVFSCIGMEVTHISAKNAPPHIQDIIDEYFGDLPMTMMTLVQFITLDSVSAVYKPLIKNDPKLVVYFAAVVLVISIVLTNLITAVIVQSALDQANQDKEAQRIHEKRERKRLWTDLVKKFKRLDTNGDGQITKEELEQALEGSYSEDIAFICKTLKLDDLEDVFELLDADSTGNIDIDEFCQGLLHALTSEQLELKRIEKHIRSVRAKVTEVADQQARTSKVVSNVEQELQQQKSFALQTFGSQASLASPLHYNSDLYALAAHHSGLRHHTSVSSNLTHTTAHSEEGLLGPRLSHLSVSSVPYEPPTPSVNAQTHEMRSPADQVVNDNSSHSEVIPAWALHILNELRLLRSALVFCQLPAHTLQNNEKATAATLSAPRPEADDDVLKQEISHRPSLAVSDLTTATQESQIPDEAVSGNHSSNGNNLQGSALTVDGMNNHGGNLLGGRAPLPPGFQPQKRVFQQ